MTTTYLHAGIATVILIVSGYLYGLETHRWAGAEDLFDASRFERLRSTYGDWAGDKPVISHNQDERSTTYSRRFTHPTTGKTVLVSLVAGPTTHVATHTPDVCYPGSGYQMRSEKKRTELPFAGRTAQFWTADFSKTQASGTQALRIHWAWADQQTWKAPDYARLTFARSRVLYKLYVITPRNEDEAEGMPAMYQEFTQALLADLDQLFVSPG